MKANVEKEKKVLWLLEQIFPHVPMENMLKKTDVPQWKLQPTESSYVSRGKV